MNEKTVQLTGLEIQVAATALTMLESRADSVKDSILPTDLIKSLASQLRNKIMGGKSEAGIARRKNTKNSDSTPKKRGRKPKNANVESNTTVAPNGLARKKRTDFGVKRTRKTPNMTIEKLQGYLNEGKTANQIAKAEGVVVRSVHRWIEKLLGGKPVARKANADKPKRTRVAKKPVASTSETTNKVSNGRKVEKTKANSTTNSNNSDKPKRGRKKSESKSPTATTTPSTPNRETKEKGRAKKVNPKNNGFEAKRKRTISKSESKKDNSSSALDKINQILS
jgi:hypothetical protein